MLLCCGRIGAGRGGGSPIVAAPVPVSTTGRRGHVAKGGSRRRRSHRVVGQRESRADGRGQHIGPESRRMSCSRVILFLRLKYQIYQGYFFPTTLKFGVKTHILSIHFRFLNNIKSRIIFKFFSQAII